MSGEELDTYSKEALEIEFGINVDELEKTGKEEKLVLEMLNEVSEVEKEILKYTMEDGTECDLIKFENHNKDNPAYCILNVE